MPKRMRVVTSQDRPPATLPAPRPRRTVVSSDNPKPSNRLTDNEIRARVSRRYATSTTLGAFGGGFGLRTGADVLDSVQSQFYSPQLSTDFLEKPQNLRERRAFYRFFYNTNEVIGRAVDIHSTVPLSKLRLVPPKGKNKKQNDYIFKFFQSMCEEMKLFKTLIEITHEYVLFGNAFCFCEDHDITDGLSPEEIGQRKEEAKKRSEFLKEEYDIRDKNPIYKGWKKIIVLPPDQVRVRKLPLTDDVAIEYVPDPETRKFITSDVPMFQDQYQTQSPTGIHYEIPSELKEKVRQSGVIPLDTNPDSGSYVYHLARKKSQYEPLGVSIVERCINTLVLLDKLRQAQTSIASRHMTPMRIVWAEDLNVDDIDNLREQVDLALVDPDFSIIANYEVHWEEIGSSNRLLDIEAENEAGLSRLLSGLGLTREILTGEGTYSGSRVSLEVMNTEYLLFREIIQDYVENYIFKPVAKRKGFVEYDDYGNEVILFPRLSFTRLSIRDNEQFFDAAYQLYQKGSVSVDLILDILNIDPDSTKEKLERDLFTVNDSIFNEVLRNLYTNVASPLAENTDVVERLAKYLKLNLKEPAKGEEGMARFSAEKPDNGNGDSRKRINVVDDRNQSEKLAKVVRYFKENPEKLEKIFEK